MNITLIGMPGSGKSTVGMRLAEETGMDFVDVDKVIIEKTGKLLSEIIAEEGNDGFRAVENRINAELEAENTVFAPGGSVIYGRDAMAHLRQISTVVYLQIDRLSLEQRLGDLKARGVSILPGQTFADLYNERCELYEQYAHIVIDTNHRTIPGVVRLIRNELSI